MKKNFLLHSLIACIATACTPEDEIDLQEGSSGEVVEELEETGEAAELSELDFDLTQETAPVGANTWGCGKPLATNFFKPYTLYWNRPALRGTVWVSGVQREYLIELPNNYNHNVAYPIVFTFHGQGAKMDNAYGQNVGTAWGKQVIAVYPQGTPTSPGKYSWFFTQNGPDHFFFNAMLNQLSARMCINNKRIFVQGTSRGGMMSNFISCVRGDVVDGSGPAASTYVINSSACKGPIPQFIVHGTADKTVPFTGGIKVRDQWLGINKCANTSKPYAGAPSMCQIYDQCASGKPVVWCVHNGGHLQPGAVGLKLPMMDFFKAL